MRLRTPIAATLITFCAPASAIADLDTPGSALYRDWLTLSGASYHFQQDRRDWRQNNPGVGLERAFNGTPWIAAAGYFRNSYDRNTLYVGGRWMPVELGPLRLGVFGLLATGYPSPILVLPAASIESGRFGASLIAIPNLPGYSGYVGLQVRVATE